jgi:hypothetical protein
MVLISLSIGVSGGTADAHGSGPCTRKGVGVQIPSRAPDIWRCSATYTARAGTIRTIRVEPIIEMTTANKIPVNWL